MFFGNVSKPLQTPDGVQSLASAGIFNLRRPDRVGNPWIHPVSCSMIGNLAALSSRTVGPIRDMLSSLHGYEVHGTHFALEHVQ